MLTNCALIHALVLALLANILKIVIVMNAQMSATLCSTKMVVFVDHAPKGTVFIQSSAKGEPQGILDIAEDLMRQKISVETRVMSSATALLS